MAEAMLQRNTQGKCNYNNMSDEELQEWHTAFQSEAQRENYINHNLEVVRHYRTEAIFRAPTFDIERNAINAAIARHGLYASSNEAVPPKAGERKDPEQDQEQEQAPPVRRPRLELVEHNDNVATTSGQYKAVAHLLANGHGSGSVNNGSAEQSTQVQDMAISKSIDSLGLHRTQ
ncbi:uncharacterized protein LOC108606344 [Drosophila busckii]|uniref:uncharacterized protein LOC108606344 n=1 Tax=Drosophila busckii TaxID=30019 RepID=UPI00083EE99D|nr:uncharacterized protein LOC108606344 [Drosophila busckii]